jgi:adenylate kinase
MLAKEINAEYLSLGKYISEHGLFSGFDRKRRTRVVDLVRTREGVHRFTNSGPAPIVVDTHHPEGIISNNVATTIFVLRCDPTILIRRLQGKKWVRQKIRENVMAEILDYCFIKARNYYAGGKVVQLDTSRSSVKHSVRAAKNILSGRKPPNLRVNWLTKLEKNASLSKYLRC